MRRQKIYILHLINSLIIGGAEVALLHYIQALGQKDYGHYVYSFGKDGPVREKIEALGVPVHFGPQRTSVKRPVSFLWNLLVLIKDLLHFIRAKNIHIIHSHLGHPNQLAVLVGKLSGIPAFPTIHSTYAFLDKRSRWDPRVHLIALVNSVIYRLADRVVTVSQEIKNIIQQRYRLKNSQIIVLKNGIIFNNNLLPHLPFEREFPDGKGKLKIVAAGRLVPLKCFDTLIKAVGEMVGQGFIDLVVLIMGDGKERFLLEKLISEMGVEKYVKLLGLRNDVVELMTESDIFVIPSSYEGLSIAMIEAMACGLAIVSSDAPGLRDYIRNGQNGLLFQVHNYKALAGSLLQLAHDEVLRASLAHAARESFEKEYDMQENIKSLDLLFRQYAR
jgi:glycosyltransferase involved in cell wall biosynthesis